MVRFLSGALIISFLFYNSAILQENKISGSQKELNNIKQEITRLQKELELKTKKERASYTAIENYSRQGHLINKMIAGIREEAARKQDQIVKNEARIKDLRSEISGLKNNYAKYVVSVYKYGSVPEWAAFFDASSINNGLLRIQYLRRFAEKREKDLAKLNNSRDELLSATQRLSIEKKEKEIIEQQKVSEEKELSGKLQERKKILNSIKNDKNELRKELTAKKEAEKTIKNLIAKLVEEAERKRKEEAERNALLKKEKLLAGNKIDKTVTGIRKETEENYDVDLSTSGFSSFAAARGKLSWPISGGKIIRRYGENRNKTLNTVTINYGIDIKAGKDINVKAVADGVISAVEWVPGFGSVIILTHKGDYRTVYSHLSEIFVKEGDKVKKGTLLAKTAEGTDGNVLHFEIWNSRANQDPELWLSAK